MWIRNLKEIEKKMEKCLKTTLGGISLRDIYLKYAHKCLKQVVKTRVPNTVNKHIFILDSDSFLQLPISSPFIMALIRLVSSIRH